MRTASVALAVTPDVMSVSSSMQEGGCMAETAPQVPANELHVDQAVATKADYTVRRVTLVLLLLCRLTW
jgi:hypothetical protein